MEDDEENRFVDVPERQTAAVEVTVPVVPERTDDDSGSWAERTAQEIPDPSHNGEITRAAYTDHLLSEVNAFNGVMPSQSLGELSHNDQLRLFRLNGLPSRPCSVRFTLADNSLDSKTILQRIISIGIPREAVRCIQRFSSGLVDVTLTKKQFCDLLLSKISVIFRQRTAVRTPVGESGVFVTVRDAPWQLSDQLIQQRLEQYGYVFSIRRAYNQSLLPEKVHDGRRVLRMIIDQPIPSFMKFGSFLVRVFYPGQPRVCWKCSSPDHLGRDCPDHFCFNCDHSGHRAYDCGEHIKCSLCKSEEHLAIDCPGNWGRRTRAQRTPSRPEEPPEDPVATDDHESIVEDEVRNSSEPESMSSDEHLDDTIQDAEVCDIEEFTSSEDPDSEPAPRKRGPSTAKPVRKKSRVEERPP